MNLDQNLRTMLRERAEGVAAAPLVVPDSTVRRVWVRKTLMTGGVVVAVVIGGFVGARSLSSDDAAPVPPADGSSRTESPITIAEGSGEVHPRAVLTICQWLLVNCPRELPGNRLLSVQVSASEESGEVFGSGSIQGGGLDDSFTVRCSRYIDDQEATGTTSLAVGGTFDEGERAGKDMALVIKDLDPDRLVIWFGREDGCDWMLDDLEARGNLTFEQVRSGNFTLPT